MNARPQVSTVAAAGGVAGGVAVVGWWWSNTEAMYGLGDWLTNAGRITGLLAGYLLAVLLLLMARIPVLERGVGADRLSRWHAPVGRYTVGLLVAHALLTIWGYAVTAHTGPVRQAGTLLLSYPDVLAATVAALLLVGVGVVSARAVRRRVRYETWYYLHLYTYLAVALSFAHVFATGAEFMTHPAARAVWAAMYVAAGGTVLWYRFAVPLYRAWRHRVRVVSVRREAPDVVSILLTGSHLDALAPKAGQFVRLRFLSRGRWWASHPFSLSAPRRGDRLRVTVKALGDQTATFGQIRPGTRVFVEGPYGAFTAERRTRRKVLLLGGGIGITPLRALFQTLPAAPGDLTLVHRVADERGLVFRAELDALAARRGQRVHYLPGPSAGPTDVLVGDRLAALVPDVAEHDVYLCGPPGFTAAARAALRRVGVPPRHIHVESFAF